MHTDEPQVDASLLNSAERVENSLVEINARIARLSMALEACLASEADIVNILNRKTPFFQHAQAHCASMLDQNEHRLLHQWEELRGLLVLRCELMARSLKDLGLTMTREITVEIEEQLERDGFKPGADGFDMLGHPDA